MTFIWDYNELGYNLVLQQKNIFSSISLNVIFLLIVEIFLGNFFLL